MGKNVLFAGYILIPYLSRLSYLLKISGHPIIWKHGVRPNPMFLGITRLKSFSREAHGLFFNPFVTNLKARLGGG